MKLLKKGYRWRYVKVGGVVRVKIDKGEDIAHLGELDQKMWTVLSCPVDGLEFDETTLRMVDTDNDGKIRAAEIISAAQWLSSVVKDKNSLLRGESVMSLDNFNDENEAGKRLAGSARQILKNLKLDKNEISVSDTSDSVAIFKETRFNGDGIIIPETAQDDSLAATVGDIMKTFGAKTDRCGKDGVDGEAIEKFYAACADYSAWQAAADSEVLPFGGDTAAAYDLCQALKDKVSDFFMRCKLIAFNGSYADAVDVSAEKVESISDKNFFLCRDEIAAYPIARPNAAGELSADAVNPAWSADFGKFLELVGCKIKKLSESDWNGIVSKFAAFETWRAAGNGLEVDCLGTERVNEILKAGKKEALLKLVEKDLEVKPEADSIDEVNKLLHLYRDFYALLKNFVIFEDFYSLDPSRHAMFESGDLYIDQRCCHLCIKIADMSKHGDMPALSGMFLIYCHCVSRVKNAEMDIVAVMTSGDTDGLRVGKNALFYGRDGQDWDAVVTRIVENPINVRNAFFSPYRKFWAFCTGLINKSAEEKNDKVIGDLQNTAGSVKDNPAAVAKPSFDIAKFAGIFAAIGMAVGFIGQALVSLAAGIAALKWWQLLLVIVVIMLLISGPSCFLAWIKLRKRNLGPVLNANGWAINSLVKVNAVFGRTLTSTARYPHVYAGDPFKKKTPLWKTLLKLLLVLAAIAFVTLYLCDDLDRVGINLHRGDIAEAIAETGEELGAGLQAAMDSAAAATPDSLSVTPAPKE